MDIFRVTVFLMSSIACLDARLYITLFNLHAEPPASGNMFIGGYSGKDSPVGNSFTFGRVLDTGTGTNLPGENTATDFKTYARKLVLGSGDERPGVYYCEANGNGETERLYTVIIRSDGKDRVVILM
ncbi:uncharacterized protein LOC144436820 [Glandiceps talaboti]